jgi:hypothetical protein
MKNNKNLIIAKANRDVYVHVREINIDRFVSYSSVCGIIRVDGSCDPVTACCASKILDNLPA